MSEEAQVKAQQAYRQGQMDIQKTNANTANINANTADRNSLINFTSGTNNNNNEKHKQHELQLNEANYAEYAVDQFQNALNGDSGAKKWVDQNREVVEAIKQNQSNSEIFKLKGKMNFDYMSPSESLNIKSHSTLTAFRPLFKRIELISRTVEFKHLAKITGEPSAPQLYLPAPEKPSNTNSLKTVILGCEQRVNKYFLK